MENASEKKLRWLHRLQWFSALAGTGLSLYLLVQHTRVKSGIQAGPSICNAGQYLNCDAVDASRYSVLFGIPLAAWGALFCFLLLLGSWLARPSSPSFAGLQKWCARLSAFGLFVELILFLVQIFDLKTICLFCVGTYVFNFAYFTFTSLLAPVTVGEKRRFFTGPLKRQASLTLSKGKWAIAILSVVAFAAGTLALPEWIENRGKLTEQQQKQLTLFFEEWKNLPSKPLPVQPEDASQGKSGAPLQLVVFSDFQCPHCRRAATILEDFRQARPDKVQLVFKNYPLDAACNSTLTRSNHDKACGLARLGVCAGRKNAFWEYHDFVFEKLRGDENWNEIFKSLSFVFTADEAAKCMNDPKTLEPIHRDLELGQALQVGYTPSIYLNGKLVPLALNPGILEKFAALELEKLSK